MGTQVLMKRLKSNVLLGFVLTTIIFVIHLFILDDYGLTWDFYHHFYAGLHHLGIPLSAKLTSHIQFIVPDPRTTNELPFGPIMLITPVISYQLLHETLHILPLDNSYNVGIIFVAMLGILSLYLFLLESENFPTALLGFLFLALFPRYFGDLHNNMKDIPQSAAFALAIWMYWRLLNYRRTKDLWMASLAFAIAFNMKVNTLFVPVIAFIWTAIVLATSLKKYLRHPLHYVSIKDLLFLGKYFIIAPLLAFMLWMPFWQNPIERLNFLFRFFQDNTQNLEVLFFGKIYRSAINVPWYFSFGYLGITTPLPVLIAFCVGFFVLIRKFLHKDPTSILFILWFFIPLSRYFYPKIGVIDGIRHFEEVVYPMCAIAAVGSVMVLNVWKKFVKGIFLKSLPIIILIVYLMAIILLYHPFQIAYFNELVGDTKGALGKFDIEYWGTSQKKAVKWLNVNARPNSVVNIVMAGDVASLYLRPDLRAKVNTTFIENADYVVVLNRQSFFYRYFGLLNYLENHGPVYTVSVQGVPAAMVFDSHAKIKPLMPWWPPKI